MSSTPRVAKPQIFHSADEHTTRNIAAQFMRFQLEHLKDSCVVFLLEGDYGAGKTQFVKGIAHALGIEKSIVSPSYVYMCEYKYESEVTKGKLIHVDAWRVEQQSDFELIGIQEFIRPGNVLAMEWPKEFKLDFGEQAVVFKVHIKELSETDREIELRTLDR